MLTLPNYQISTQIYESANSLVYRAIRLEDHQPMILKVLKQDYPTPEELTRYRQEYEIMAHLNLDGVVKTYYLEKYQNTLVIMLEDFGGESLKNLFNTSQCYLTSEETDGGFSLSRFLQFAIQVAESLGQIHAAHIIHKDINPANIVWNHTTNQLKIIDFGISSRLPRETPALKNPEQLEGTLAYISPEQTGRMNCALDYRSDLYSLGVTFYEILTGQLPFESDDALELVHCHIAKMPTPVGQINPHVPPIISAIVMKLMEKNVDDRYQSAFGLKFDLEKCLENLANLQGLTFELAQNDFSGQLQIPQKLYGRTHEVNTLLQAFERISQGTAEIMLIAGYSGVGKTALVHEVYKPMTEKRGYFAAGKFDQFQRNVPYFALTQAFNGFCDYLLTENAQQLAKWQQKILSALGDNGQVLIEVIPHLELVIGKQPPVASLGASEAQNRLILLFQNFCQVLCQQQHPVILFIDDLQWADSASLNLIKLLMTHYQSQYFLFIGAYRNNEVDEGHSLSLMLTELQAAQVTINTLELPNIGYQSINQLMAETLSCPPEQVESLTDLVYEKTHGNAFFVRQFLRTLYEEATLQFDYSTHRWQWQIEEIRQQDITDNVVDLMIRKIESLPTETQTILRLAACIGNRFDLKTLSVLLTQAPKTLLPQLWSAIKENLILSIDKNYELTLVTPEHRLNINFCFIHDRVQQAAYDLIPETQRQHIHLQIGQFLLQQATANEIDERIFDIVQHLNQSCDLLTNETDKRQLSALNLRAGHRAKASAAYQSALIFYTQASELAVTDWKNDYAFSLELYENAAEAAFFAGAVTQMEQLAEKVFQHANNETDKVEIYRLLIQKFNTEGQCNQAIDLGLDLLSKLGYPLPQVDNLATAIAAMRQFNETVDEQAVTALVELTKMQDQTALKAAEIMVSLLPSTFITSRMEVCILLLIKSLQLYTRFGNAPVAPFAYGLYGGFNFIFLNHVTFAHLYAEITLKLLEEPFYSRNKSRGLHMVGFFIAPWVQPLVESLELLLAGVETGKDFGDKEFAAYNADAYALISLWAGQPLLTVQQRTLSMLALSKSQQMQTQYTRLASYKVAIHNLQQPSSTPYMLLAQEFDETQQLPSLIESNEKTGLCYILTNKLWLAYLFEHNDACQTLVKEQEQYEMASVGIYTFAGGQFYRALALLTLPTINPENAEKISQILTNMKFWASTAPMNFQHKVDLIEAERAKVAGHHWEAIKYYEKAIQGAKKHEFLPEEALANERFAHFWLEQNNEIIAKAYLKESLYCYQQWGAVAKVKQLEEKYPQWLTSVPTVQANATVSVFTDKRITTKATVINSTSQPTNHLTALLDLSSIIKASQALSSEIVLNKLLENLIYTLIENAGAERGLLILKQNEQWVIEAEGVVDSEKIIVLQSLPLEGFLPIAVINYVIRTNKSVVLNNAQRDSIYTNDPYIRQHQVKSLLCTPITHQGHLVGLLYLENNLTEGAFTPTRLQILEMLSAQAAISLENALLYHNLEQKVAERTAQLAQANLEISTLNERLKEDNLRMSAELDVAKHLQHMVLPKEQELQAINNLDIAGFMEPADEVGGDYYDILQNEGHLKIGIGDVTGHGLESGVLMLMVQTAVRSLLEVGLNSTQFITILNRIIYKNIKRIQTDKNLTLSLIDYQDGQLQITGQHEEVLVVRQNGHIERIDTIELGFSVGVLKNIESFVAQQEITLQPGDGIVLYTDGITEAQKPDMTDYGLERLCEVVSCHWHLTAQEIQQAIITDVKQFTEGQKLLDDITLLILKQK